MKPEPLADLERLVAIPSVAFPGLHDEEGNIDMTSIAGSSNVLVPEARAKLSMRIVPGSEPERELDALVRHLESRAPWGAQVEVERVDAVVPPVPPPGARSRRPTGSRPGRPAAAARSHCWQSSLSIASSFS